MKNVLGQTMKRTAQQESNLKLREKVTRGKYVPISIYKALARREKLISMGYGFHWGQQRRDVVKKINAIK